MADPRSQNATLNCSDETVQCHLLSWHSFLFYAIDKTRCL